MSQQQPPWSPPGEGDQRYAYQPYGSQPVNQPPYDGPGYGPAPAESDGLGVASLVLSIIWFVGVGSILAVIFGAKSRRRARRGGRTSGLGTAGLVIGIIGIFGAVIFWIFVVAAGISVNNTFKIDHFQPGQTASFAGNASSNGIRSVTVYGVTYPVDAQDSSVPGQGEEFAVADVQVCAGPDGSQNGPDLFDFDLVFSGSQTATAQPFGEVKKPAIDDVSALAANQCLRGYVAFQIAAGSTPIGVRYGPYFDTIHRDQWVVLGSS